MRYFCTLFDSNYLTRGLSLYDSLIKTHKDFHLYIFAFDDLSLSVLTQLRLDKTTIVSLNDFEDEQLLKIKPTRSPMEYCWTCTPSVIRYCLQKWDLPMCTYLDADIYFFNSSEPIFKEFEEAQNDVLITEHRFTEKYLIHSNNGLYNVQFMVFKNNPNALKVLNWWRDRCNEWCFAYVEDGKLGDQKYLDVWTTQFQKIHELKHLGGALGPWNIQQYEVNPQNEALFVKHKKSGQQYKAIFYHFHNFKFYQNGYARALYYELSADIIEYFYTPYLKNVISNYKEVSSNFPNMYKKGFQNKEEDPTYIESCLKSGNFDGDNFLIFDRNLYSRFASESSGINYLVKKIIKKMSFIFKYSNKKVTSWIFS